MLLDRVPGQPSNALVDPRGQAAREFVCAWPHSFPRHLRQGACGPQPLHVGADYLAPTFSGANNGRDTMGMYCLRALIPVHTAGAGEIMEILWSDYYGAVLFGEGREIACIRTKDAGSKSWRRRRRRTARSTFSCPDRSFDTRVRSFSSIASSCRAAPRWAS